LYTHANDCAGHPVTEKNIGNVVVIIRQFQVVVQQVGGDGFKSVLKNLLNRMGKMGKVGLEEGLVQGGALDTGRC
jgi:hypothetical protein